MSAELERGLQAIELLSRAADGLTFTEVATALATSKGPTHRLLSELVRLGYARVDGAGRHHLTLKAASQALQYLELIPMIDLARPLLAKLADATGELARLNLIDGSHLVRVSKAQGRQSGLRYDPEHGGNVPLACATSGYMLLSELTDDEALARLEAEGFAPVGSYGKAAPRTREEALAALHTSRENGYLYLPDVYEDGIATLAYPVKSASSGDFVGILTISGPSFRFTAGSATEALPLMAEVAEVLSHVPVDELLSSPTQVA